MIKIIEDTPKKLSGLTSLFVSFDYNAEAVNIIKSATKYVYDKTTFTWELPITSLSYLLDNLTYIDDITLKLIKDNKEDIHYYPKLVSQYKLKPFDHQLTAIEYGLNHDNWLLLDEPGLGKTSSIIHLAEELKLQKSLQHCLIICGINSLKLNWEDEIHKHSNETVKVIGKRINKNGKITYATIKERAQEILNPIDEFFIVINIESIRSDDIINAFKKTKNKIDMAVFDEAHKAKSLSTNQGHNLLKLKDYKYKVALTGTLIVNNPLDAYASLRWLNIEHSTLTSFKSQYCLFGGYGNYQIVGYKNIDLLKHIIENCSLRRLKSDLKDLPPKTIIPEIIEMNDQHRDFYESVKQGIKAECDKIELKTDNVLALTTRLRQASTCPSILTSNNIQATKIERCIELIEDIVANGDKVVVMSQFKEPLKILYKRLKQYNPLLGSGDVTDDEFNKNKNLFQTDDKYKVFLGTGSKAGTGITLNAASYMICLDLPYTAALQQQIEDRIHRVNNTNPVFIYRLICKGTIDEVILNIITTKEAISDFIVDDKLNENTVEVLRNYIQDF